MVLLLLMAVFVAFAGAVPGRGTEVTEQRSLTVTWDSAVCAEMPEPDSAVCDYGPLFNTAGRQYEMDPRLIAAVAWVESGHFDPDVIDCTETNSAGALGIMQFMPNTAAGRGIDACDPNEAIPEGAKFLRENYDKFGTWELAVAAYNAGAGAVEECDCIPENGETELHVPKVMDKWEEYKELFPAGVADCPAVEPDGSTEELTHADVDWSTTDAASTQATMTLLNTVVACFGRGSNIYCEDPRDGTFEHPRGRACDFMLSDQARGQAMAEWLMENAEDLNILYIIWWRRWWPSYEDQQPWEEWDGYSGGNPHTDHVHVSLKLMPGDPGSAECVIDSCTEDW